MSYLEEMNSNGGFFNEATPAAPTTTPDWASQPSTQSVDDIRASLFASTGGTVTPESQAYYKDQFQPNPDGSQYSVSTGGQSGDDFYKDFPYVGTNANPNGIAKLSNTVGISNISNPIQVTPPDYDRSIRNQYMNTFRDPNMFWDEYSQGRGTQFTEGAARAMAKSGRTGMLPTLGTLAHQDYMSNYLPSVRKDMAPGLSWESSWNQNLGQQYGQELGYSKDIYNTDTQRYGAELDYDIGMRDLQLRTKDLETKEKLGLLDIGIRELEISERTKAQFAEILMKGSAELSDAEYNRLLDDIAIMTGVDVRGEKTLAETTNPTSNPITDSVTSFSEFTPGVGYNSQPG